MDNLPKKDQVSKSETNHGSSDNSERKGKVTSLRLLPGKEYVYNNFKEYVTETQHSDVCYVTTCLWEAYIQAMKNTPDPNNPVTLNLPRQNIQINLGCNFNYNVKKGRRQPSEIQGALTQPKVELRKNVFFPLLLEEWTTLSEEKKKYWLERLIEAGIYPSQNQPKLHKEQRKHNKKISKPMEQCTTNVYKPKFMRFLKWLVTPLPNHRSA